jgi:hypothetical protein
MNSAKRKLEQKLQRQDTIANTIGWITLSALSLLTSMILFKSLQLFLTLGV